MNYVELSVFILYFLFMLGIGLYFFFKSKDAAEEIIFFAGILGLEEEIKPDSQHKKEI